MIDRALLAVPAVQAAPLLLGAVLAHATGEGVVAVRLTEVEAYEGEALDPGSHAFRGRTPRNATMFGPAGRLYAYFSYGIHTCVNVTCEAPGRAAAVLLRAGEVVEGLDLARARRTTSRSDADLARGPARLAVALGIGLDEDGADLLAGGAWSLSIGAPGEVRTGPRVGVSGDGGDGALFPWRFWTAGDPTVSAYRPAVARRR